MDHKENLDKLNRESIEQIEAYLKSKGALKEDEHLKVVRAHEEWQNAWSKLMETLMVIERLEI